jgi:hypothetical protein
MLLASVHPTLAGAFLLRGLLLWAGVRLLVHLVQMSVALPPLEGAEVAVLMTFIALAAGYADVRRRRESVLLANLGIGRGALLLLLVAPPAFAELTVYISSMLLRAS